MKVEYITVDFAVEEGVYDIIWEGLAGKEIGILGILHQELIVNLYLTLSLYQHLETVSNFGVFSSLD